MKSVLGFETWGGKERKVVFLGKSVYRSGKVGVFPCLGGAAIDSFEMVKRRKMKGFQRGYGKGGTAHEESTDSTGHSNLSPKVIQKAAKLMPGAKGKGVVKEVLRFRDRNTPIRVLVEARKNNSGT